MIDQLYIAVTALASGGTLCFGLCFLFLYIPESAFLKGYRVARKTAASAYLLLSLLYLVEIIFDNPGINDPLSKSIKLVVGALEALFFTYTFISLLNTHFVTRKKVLWELIPISAFVIAMVTIYILAADSLVFRICYYAFMTYYVSSLVRYLILFLREFRDCFNRAANYYAEEENLRFRWIYYSFFGMLAIGIILVLMLFVSESESEFLYPFFIISFVLVYSYFGIGFIDYSYRYKILEPLSESIKSDDDQEHQKNDKSEQARMLGEALNSWVLQERFLQPGLTIDHLSTELNTNRTYLSAYINQVEQQTFRAWINQLKINKAQKLLLNNPDMLVVEVAGLAGYTDSSNFNKQFVKITGSSAQNWREQQLSGKADQNKIKVSE